MPAMMLLLTSSTNMTRKEPRMATTYTSTVEVNVWKEHTCVGCGTVYRYLFKRTKTGQGATPDAARANVHKAVVAALEKEVDMQPCPGCGLYQPDMIGAQRWKRHWIVVGCGLPFFALWLILALADVLAYSATCWLFALTGVALALVNLVVNARNPNANLEENLRLGQSREQAGELWVPADVKSVVPASGANVGRGLGAGHVFA